MSDFLHQYEAKARAVGIWPDTPYDREATPWKSDLPQDEMLLEQVRTNGEALLEGEDEEYDPVAGCHLSPSDRQEVEDMKQAAVLEEAIKALGDNGELNDADGELVVYKRPEAAGGGYLVWVPGQVAAIEPPIQTAREAASVLGGIR